jgi:hypothetical protein
MTQNDLFSLKNPPSFLRSLAEISLRIPWVVLHKGLGDGSGLLEGAGVIKGEALLVIAAMIAFDKGVLLRVMGITDLDVDAQTGSEAQESRGTIAALLGCLPSGNPDLR